MKQIWSYVNQYKRYPILFIVIFLILIGVGNIFNWQWTELPFNYNIWGTVADWTIVIVTFAGTLYIALSFNEQRKINVQQAEINRLSMERDRREIRPYFKIASERHYPEDGVYMMNLELTHAFATSIMFTYFNKGEYIAQTNVIQQAEWEVGAKMQIQVVDNKKEDAIKGSVGLVHIKFKDEDDRCYDQTITMGNNRFDITFPKRIDNFSVWDGWVGFNNV